MFVPFMMCCVQQNNSKKILCHILLRPMLTSKQHQCTCTHKRTHTVVECKIRMNSENGAKRNKWVHGLLLVCMEIIELLWQIFLSNWWIKKIKKHSNNKFMIERIKAQFFGDLSHFFLAFSFTYKRWLKLFLFSFCLLI